MQFSFYLPCYWPDTSRPWTQMYQEMLEQAKLAEDLGFKAFGVPEHHFINYLVHPNPLLTAVKVADATRSIPIITSVLVLPFLDMRRLAGEIAQADCLTGGRLEIGVGRGAFKYEFDRYRVRPEDSRALMDEGLELLIKLLTEYEVEWHSDHYDFEPLSITPRPVQQPHPPIWIAAVSPEAIYHSVLKGFHVMTTPLRESLNVAAEQVAGFHRGVTAAGESARHLKLSMLRMIYVAKDRRDAHEKLEIANENDRRFYNVFKTDGTVTNGAIVPLDTGRTLEEVDANLIIGTAEQCVEKLQTYVDMNLFDFLANMSFGAPHRDVIASMERFARDVLPHIERQSKGVESADA